MGEERAKDNGDIGGDEGGRGEDGQRWRSDPISLSLDREEKSGKVSERGLEVGEERATKADVEGYF